MGASMKSFNQIFLATVIVLSLAFASVSGQTNYKILKKTKYTTWIYPINDSPKIKGYLFDIGEDHIVFSHTINSGDYKINFKDIEKIELRKDGSIWLGMAIGAFTGASAMFAINSSLGWIYHPKNDPIIGASVGALIGGFLGSIKIYKPINGNPQYQKEKLMKYKVTY